MLTKIIENDFPIEGINDIAPRDATGHDSKLVYHRSLQKWWAARAACVFRAIIITSLLEEWPKGMTPPSLIQTNNRNNVDWSLFWGSPTPNSNRGIFYRNLQHIFKNKVILDPFMGGGVTLIEGLRLGTKVIGLDINPVAWFATKVKLQLPNISREDLENEIESLENDLRPKLLQFYETHCPQCESEGKPSLVPILYVFWVKEVECIKCNNKVKLFPSYLLAKDYTGFINGWDEKDKPNIYICKECGAIFGSESKAIVECPNGHSFNPAQSQTDGSIYDCSCSASEPINLATQRMGGLPLKMEAVEYLCPRHGRGFKQPDNFDKNLYQEAEDQWNKVKGEYLEKFVPDQLIPIGEETERLIKYGYSHWRDLFNERQLFCLTTIFKRILQVKDDQIKEVLLSIFTSMLQTNCLITRYDPTTRKVATFQNYLWPPQMPVENNVWGSIGPRGMIRGRLNLLRSLHNLLNAHKYITNPDEKYPSIYPGKKKVKDIGDRFNSNFTDNFQNIKNNVSNCMIFAKNAERLTSVIQGQVDAVITDPPYYQNVQYGELSNFFYVWLKKALEHKYPDIFSYALTDNTREIVVNKTVGKPRDFYIMTMTTTFNEIGKILKDDGILAFTFHHSDPKSWTAILTALLDAGFYVTAAYPVHQENVGTKRGSMRIRGGFETKRTEVRTFDIVLVARKKLEKFDEDRYLWDEVRKEIYMEAEDAVVRVKKIHEDISYGDKKTIVLGKLLEVYSKRHPNIYKDDHRVEVEEAAKEVESICEEHLSRVAVPPGIGGFTEFYIAHLAPHGSLEYNELLKIAQPRGVAIDKLKRFNLIETRGDRIEVKGPVTRGEAISSEAERSSLHIDPIHYLYFCLWADKRINWDLIRADTNLDSLIDLSNYLYKNTGDIYYARVVNLLERALEAGFKIRKPNEPRAQKRDKLEGVKKLDEFIR